MEKINQSEIAQAISEELGMSTKDINRVLNMWEKVAAKQLDEGNRVMLWGFGSLVTKEMPAGSFSPTPDTEIEYDAYNMVVFRSSKKLKLQLNDGE